MELSARERRAIMLETQTPAYARTSEARRAIDLHYKRAKSLRACLLYTSPSPRDLSTSRMPSSA